MADEKKVQGLMDIVNYFAEHEFTIETALTVLTIAIVHMAKSDPSKQAIRHAAMELQIALTVLTREAVN